MNIEQLIKQCADLADGLKLNTTINIETNSPYTSANIVAIIKTKEIRSYSNYQESTLAALGEGSNLEEALINLKNDLINKSKRELDSLSLKTNKLTDILSKIEL